MKLKKVFAGMAASAIAMSVCAMTSATTASALDTEGHAGIAFQTNTTWNFRDLFGTEGTDVFPAAKVGVQGGAYGNGSVECSDTTIQYDGTYTVSIATSGKIEEANTDKADNEKGFYLNEENTLTRKDSPWSMLCNYEAAESDNSDLTQDQIEWVEGGKTDKFNMLSITTDIPCEYNDDDKPEINGTVVEVSDITVDMCGTQYTATGDDVKYKSDVDTLAVALINTYGDSTIDPAAMPASDGTITVTFTVKGLGEDPNKGGDSSSEGGNSSNTSSTSSGSTSSTKGGSKGGSGSTSKASTTSTTTSSAAESDKTANAEAGAPAGIALALAAVAGAAVVVSRKK